MKLVIREEAVDDLDEIQDWIAKDSLSAATRVVRALRERFWRETPEARRETMMPFLWGMIARQGQIFGDPERHCDAMVTNGKNTLSKRDYSGKRVLTEMPRKLLWRP